MSANFVRNEFINYQRLKVAEVNCVYLFFKRIFDIVFSVIGIILLFPLGLLVSILILIDSKGPIFYCQTRVGKYFKKFKIFKFRTMIYKAEDKGSHITSLNDWRITRFGSFFRKFKIDELPQLLNVFIGNMSFVGPRPEIPEYINYNNDFDKVLSIKPGITDFASIKYRNENELLYKAKLEGKDILKYYKEKILVDKINLCLEYIENISLFVDICIIIKTIFCLKQNNVVVYEKDININKKKEEVYN